MTTCDKCRVDVATIGSAVISTKVIFCPLHARAEAVEKAARKVVAVKEDAFKAIFKAIDDLESALALCEEKGKEKA